MVCPAPPRSPNRTGRPPHGAGTAPPVAGTGSRAARGFLVALAALATLGTLAGCSVKARDLLSAASLEAKISAELAHSYGVSPPHVHCPNAVPAVIGSRFACATHLDGQPLTVSGDVSGPQGSVAVRPATAVVVVAEARAGSGATWLGPRA